jgi:hypothetical protein
MSMKRLIILTTVVLMSSGVFAYTFFGAPTAELNQGQWSAGYKYTYEELDFDLGSGLGTLEDVDVNRHYFDLGYGLTETLEANLLLGVTDHDAPGLSGGNEFSWGFNAKWSFIDGDTMDWGILYQMTWFEAEDSGVKVDDAYDIQIAVGPTIDMGGWKLYGGGYWYMLDADLRAGGAKISSISEDDDFGGFVGVSFQIMENANIGVEYAFSGDTTGIGAGIDFRF